MQLTKTQTIALFLGSTSASMDFWYVNSAMGDINDSRDMQLTDPPQTPWQHEEGYFDEPCDSNQECASNIEPTYVCADVYS